MYNVLLGVVLAVILFAGIFIGYTAGLSDGQTKERKEIVMVASVNIGDKDAIILMSEKLNALGFVVVPKDQWEKVQGPHK
ncbi:MAG: hypothetical protein WC373_12115 [Smithella sp.]|jgi:hypothetical protein